MAARNSLFPATRLTVKKSVNHFNARGKVEDPVFVLVRPNVGKGIDMTVRAHCLDEGKWIAEPTWGSLCGHLPFDGEFPGSTSKIFQSLSEAVEHGIERALLQIKTQLGEILQESEWRTKFLALVNWTAEAVYQTRKNDDSLPLQGSTHIDICSGGLGGFGMALTSLGADCLLAVEIDPEASHVYKQNVKPRRMHDDLCTLDGTKLKCDILTIGLLCQAFSTAGKRKGFADPVLANVYHHTLRLMREIDAKVVIIECASQLLTQAGGKDAEVVRQTLMKAGYRVQHRTLNASGFGSAQSRERSFIVATRSDMAVDDIMGYVFPKEQTPTACVADILEPNIPAKFDAADFELHSEEPETRSTSLAEVGLMRKAKTGETIDAQGYRVYSPKGLACTLTASGGGRGAKTGVYLVGTKARALTPREACRLQGLPEWAQHHPVASHALLHAGNAVAVPVARELGRQLRSILGSRS
jgi:DNA (cytosine-5)-methyltransferase 1